MALSPVEQTETALEIPTESRKLARWPMTLVTRGGTAAAFAVDDFQVEEMKRNEALGRTSVVDQCGGLVERRLLGQWIERPSSISFNAMIKITTSNQHTSGRWGP